MASPRTMCDPNDSAMPFSGWPSKRFRKISDHATVKPQLAGRNGDIATPLAASVSTHAPSEPSRGQLAPPSASTVARASTARWPSAFETTDCPSSSQPVQRCRSTSCTPIASSRRSHARSSGDALNACGNTRPLEPTKVGWPNASLHARNASGGNASIAGARCGIGRAIARQKFRQCFAVGEIEPAAPGHQKLAARRRHRVIDGDAARRPAPALRPPSARRDRRR